MASRPHQVPFNVAVARELTTFENEPTLEQALKWRLNEACDEIERLIEQLEAMRAALDNHHRVGYRLEWGEQCSICATSNIFEGSDHDSQADLSTGNSQAEDGGVRRSPAESGASLEEQLGAQRSVLEKIVREADSSLEVLPPTNTDTAYFDGRREAALEALAASNPASVRCGDLRSFGDVDPITCQRVQGHEGEHAAWARPADPSSEKQTWDSSPASDPGNWPFSVEAAYRGRGPCARDRA